MMPMPGQEWYDELPEFITQEQRTSASSTWTRPPRPIRLHAVHWSVLDLEQPVQLTLPIADLVAA
jgi:hypothetical protein